MVVRPEQLKAPEGSVLTVWVIYDHPRDRPDGYVLRAQFAMPGGVALTSQEAWFAKDPDELRRILPWGLVKLMPRPEDDPVIMETWI